MSFFQEQLDRDAKNIFMNPAEFGVMHKVNGRDMVIVIDDDQLQYRKSSASNPTDGVYNASLLCYTLKSDFEKRPVIGSTMKIDSRDYKVADLQEDEVMYTITLRRIGS